MSIGMKSTEPTFSGFSSAQADEVWTVHPRDARSTGRFLEEVAATYGGESQPFLTTTITSPPYANLVDYGTSDQIGFGQSYDSYLSECETIFKDVFAWTKRDGSLWIVADTMMGPSTAGAPSALIPLPFALAERAGRAGWTLKDVIVWRKDRTRPWSSTGRLRNGFEYVLFFVKTGEFKHYVDRVRDLRGLKSWWVKYPERHNPWGMTPENVWDIPIPVQGSWASNELRHACPFPEELVQRMVQVSSDPGDVVFDPFAGSGMVPAVSESLGRVPLGTELNPEFCRVYRDWVRPTVLNVAPDPLDVDSLDITATLLSLRVLKYPKTVLSQIMRAGVSRSTLVGALVIPHALDLTPKKTPFATLACVLVVPNDASDSDIESVAEYSERAARQQPLSRWGVTAEITVRRQGDLALFLSNSEYWATYVGGRTWNASGRLRSSQVEAWLANSSRKGVPPILSPIQLSVELEE